MIRLLEVIAIASTLLLAFGIVVFCIYSPVTFMVITLIASGCLLTYSTIQAVKHRK